MLYIEQLHKCLVNIEVELVNNKREYNYVLTLLKLYKDILDTTVSRVLSELCNSTSIPLRHRFVITYEGEVFYRASLAPSNVVIHSIGINDLTKYSDIIPSRYRDLDIEHILHFNQEVHEFKHIVLRWYDDHLTRVSEQYGLDKSKLGIMCLL